MLNDSISVCVSGSRSMKGVKQETTRHYGMRLPTEEEAQKMSAVEFISLTQMLGRWREFTEEEDVFIRRMKRRLQNKEHARETRVRRGLHIQTMEEKIKSLEAELLVIRTNYDIIQESNFRLRCELEQYRMIDSPVSSSMEWF